jgi:hypothetical protein
VSAPHDRPRTRKRKPTGLRREQRRDLLGLADYFDCLKSHVFKGDAKTATAKMEALGWTPEQIAEELDAPWYRHRDLAQAVEYGETVARSNGQAIAGPGTGIEDADSIRRKLRRERGRQGQARPRGRPKS